MSKALVLYFSASGVTARLATNLAEALGCDLFEIKPARPYSNADLNWMDKTSRSSVEMSDKAFRPEIAETCGNINEYDTVFLGFPIWWYVAPTVVNTFLESHNLSGKRIVVFATSGGSGLGNTLDYLAPSAPGATLVKGKVINGSYTAKELADWAKDYL